MTCVVTCMAQNQSGGRGWNGLRPMHSTCEDVKRTLGVTTCAPTNGTYDFGTERVRITFSTIHCARAWQKSWDVPVGTVLSIERHFRTPLRLSEFGVDLTKFKSTTTDSDVIIYSGEEDGVSMWVVGDEIRDLYYQPVPSDKALLCTCAK